MSYGRIASAPGEPGKRRDLFLGTTLAEYSWYTILQALPDPLMSVSFFGFVGFDPRTQEKEEEKCRVTDAMLCLTWQFLHVITDFLEPQRGEYQRYHLCLTESLSCMVKLPLACRPWHLGIQRGDQRLAMRGR